MNKYEGTVEKQTNSAELQLLLSTLRTIEEADKSANTLLNLRVSLESLLDEEAIAGKRFDSDVLVTDFLVLKIDQLRDLQYKLESVWRIFEDDLKQAYDDIPLIDQLRDLKWKEDNDLYIVK